MSCLLREVRPESTSSHSDDRKGSVIAPTLGTIAEKSAHKGFGGQKTPSRRHSLAGIGLTCGA